MSPSAEHEGHNPRFVGLIGVLADEMNLEVGGLGATKFTRRDPERGFEAGSCFQVQNVDKIRNKERVDLATDPPPDLVAQMDITSASINKLALYREFGVPEAWRYNGRRLEIRRLVGAGHESTGESVAFPGVSAVMLTRLLQQGKSLGRPGWLRMTRVWAHDREVPTPRLRTSQVAEALRRTVESRGIRPFEANELSASGFSESG